MSFGPEVRYMTPSTTSGVVWNVQVENVWYTHFISRFFALLGVMRLRRLYRWLSYPPEYINQFCGSLAAPTRRSVEICASIDCAAAIASAASTNRFRRI